MPNQIFNYTFTCQNIPFFPFSVSQAGQQTEQRKFAFCHTHEAAQPSQTFTVITFPQFLLCDSCLVNIAAEIHYLIFFSCYSFSPLFFRWVSVNTVWMISFSCELLLRSPFSCSPLYDSAIRFEKEKITLFFFQDFFFPCCDWLWFRSKRKRQCVRTDTLHAVELHGGLFWIGPYRDKSLLDKCQRLWSLSDIHGVRCHGLTWSLLILVACREPNGY